MHLESQIWFYKTNKGILEGENIRKYQNPATREMSEEWRRSSPTGLRGEHRHSPKSPIFSLGEPSAYRSLRKSGATTSGWFALHGIPWVSNSCCDHSSRFKCFLEPGGQPQLHQAGKRAGNHRAHGCQQSAALRRPEPQLLDFLSFQAILGTPCQWDLGYPFMPLGSDSGSGSLLKTGNLTLMSPSSGSRKFVLYIGEVENNKNKTTTSITKYPNKQGVVTPHFSLQDSQLPGRSVEKVGCCFPGPREPGNAKGNGLMNQINF